MDNKFSLKNSRKSIQHYTPSINATADDLIEAVRQGLFLLSSLYQSNLLKSYLFLKLHGRRTPYKENEFCNKIFLKNKLARRHLDSDASGTYLVSNACDLIYRSSLETVCSVVLERRIGFLRGSGGSGNGQSRSGH